MREMTGGKDMTKNKNQFCVIVGNVPIPFGFDDETAAREFVNAATNQKIPALLFPIKKVDKGIIYPRKPVGI